MTQNVHKHNQMPAGLRTLEIFPLLVILAQDKEDGVERKPEWKYPTTEEHVHPQGHHLQGVCEVAGLPLPLDPWLRIPTCCALDFVFAPQFHLHNLIKICFLFIDLGSL